MVSWGVKDLAEFCKLSVAQTILAIKRLGPAWATRLEDGTFTLDRDAAIADWTPRKLAVLREPSNAPVLPQFEEVRAMEAWQVAEKYLSTMVRIVTVEDWEDIVRVKVEQAKEGDHKAAVWLSSYLIGTPIQRILAKVTAQSQDSFTPEKRAQALESLLSLIGADILEGEVKYVADAESGGADPDPAKTS